MKEKTENKNDNLDITSFVNSIDYMNKDIFAFNNFNQCQLNKEIINLEINLKPFIDELNNKLGKRNLFIQNEIQLYE